VSTLNYSSKNAPNPESACITMSEQLLSPIKKPSKPFELKVIIPSPELQHPQQQQQPEQ